MENRDKSCSFVSISCGTQDILHVDKDEDKKINWNTLDEKRYNKKNDSEFMNVKKSQGFI